MDIGRLQKTTMLDAKRSGNEIINCLSQRNARRLTAKSNKTWLPVMESFNQEVLELLQKK